MKHNFKVGDRVRIKEGNAKDKKDEGLVGVIVCLGGHMLFDCTVEFENEYAFTHRGGMANGKNVYRFYKFNEIESLVCKHELIVYSKGPETVAVEKVNGEVVKKAVAKCSPSDEYKWETGRKLALMRLLEEEKPEKKPLYNGKVVCTHLCGLIIYTIGKIYEFKDGVSYDDDQNRMSIDGKPVENFKEWIEYSQAKWLEIVE